MNQMEAKYYTFQYELDGNVPVRVFIALVLTNNYSGINIEMAVKSAKIGSLLTNSKETLNRKYNEVPFSDDKYEDGYLEMSISASHLIQDC